MDRVKGFTITEVIVAIALAGIFIVVMSTTVSSLISLNGRTRRLAAAQGIAESKVEELRSDSFLDLPVDGTVVDFTDELPAFLADPSIATYTVTDLTPSLKRIDLVVEYNDFNTDREISFSTVIGELGVGQY